MKKITLLLLLFFAFSQCNVLEDDPLPTPGQPLPISASNMLMTLNTSTGLVNVPGLLSAEVSASEVNLVKQPEFGVLSVLNEKFLKYQPSISKENYEEEIILTSPQDPGEEVSLLIVVRSDPSYFCLVNEFEPTYLGMPLTYSIRKGESFETDLLDLFCDYQRGGNAGVAMFDHPELTDKGFNIHISTQYANLTFNPPADFTGKSGIIYELCYDLQDQNCINQNLFQDCPTYPRSCKYFLYTYVEIEVAD